MWVMLPLLPLCGGRFPFKLFTHLFGTSERSRTSIVQKRTYGLEDRCLSIRPRSHKHLDQVEGLEPSHPLWKSGMQPKHLTWNKFGGRQSIRNPRPFLTALCLAGKANSLISLSSNIIDQFFNSIHSVSIKQNNRGA